MENPRAFLQVESHLILVVRRRQAHDGHIGLRYPIRVYQTGRSSILSFSIFLDCLSDWRDTTDRS
jgi:hypothetical protein